MSTETTATLPTFTKCPWPKSQVRIMVKQAIDRVGGQRGFDFLGPQIQRAIIVEACWRSIAAQHNTIIMTPDAVRSIEKTFCEVAGIWETEG
jgi:hypothetical protein